MQAGKEKEVLLLSCEVLTLLLCFLLCHTFTGTRLCSFVTYSPVHVYAAATRGQQHDVSSQKEGNTSSLEVQASYCSCASCSRLCTRSSSSPHSARNLSTSVLCEEALQCSRKHLLMLYPHSCVPPRVAAKLRICYTATNCYTKTSGVRKNYSKFASTRQRVMPLFVTSTMGVQQLTFSLDAIKAPLTAMCEVSKLEYWVSLSLRFR